MSNNGILRTAHVSGLLRRMYDAAVASAQPDLCVARHLPEPPKGRTVVIGVGKAAAAMAKAVEAHWQGPLSGVVVVPAGASLPLRHIRVMVGSHPVPDQSSVDGARALMQAVAGLTPDDLVIALVSGGGSALCALPAQGLTLEDKQEVTRALLLIGSAINDIYTVRRHLSAIKGGRLAAAAFPARVVTLLISDIPGDDPALIASGPTLPDTSTCADALEILQRYEITTRPAVVQALEAGLWESVKPDNARLTGHKHLVVASAWTGLQAAALLAQSEGWACHILSDAMEGEARELAKAHADLERYSGLKARGFVSDEKVNEVRTNEAAAAATLKADQATLELARLQLSYTTVRSPFAGVVGARLVFPGSSVKINDTALAVVNRVDPLYVTFSVPERHLAKLREGMRQKPLKVGVTQSGNKEARLEGTAKFIDNAVDPVTGTIVIKAVLDNKDGKLTPGQFLNVSMTLDKLADAVLIPNEAVQQGAEGNFLYVVKPDNTVEVRKIEVISTYQGASAIGKGLSAGETVVTDGQLRLTPGATVKTKSAKPEEAKAAAPSPAPAAPAAPAAR